MNEDIYKRLRKRFENELSLGCNLASWFWVTATVRLAASSNEEGLFLPVPTFRCGARRILPATPEDHREYSPVG